MKCERWRADSFGPECAVWSEITLTKLLGPLVSCAHACSQMEKLYTVRKPTGYAIVEVEQNECIKEIGQLFSN